MIFWPIRCLKVCPTFIYVDVNIFIYFIPGVLGGTPQKKLTLKMASGAGKWAN